MRRRCLFIGSLTLFTMARGVFALEVTAEMLTYITEDYRPYSFQENGAVKGLAVDLLRMMPWPSACLAPPRKRRWFIGPLHERAVVSGHLYRAVPLTVCRTRRQNRFGLFWLLFRQFESSYRSRTRGTQGRWVGPLKSFATSG